MSEIVGRNFGDVKFKRTNKVLPLSAVNCSLKIRDDIVPVNTMQLFNRMLCAMKSKDDLSECLAYELAPYPLSLFDEVYMRKGKKSVLFDIFETTWKSMEELEGACFVIDGGHLLHRVVWPLNVTYKDIQQLYVSYIIKHYGAHTHIVFDGYNASLHTNASEQQCRSRKLNSSDIVFHEDMDVTTKQDKFLANAHNKSRLIAQLMPTLRCAGIQVEQSADDADTLIINTAIHLSSTSNTVVSVVGEDVDLLVLLAASASPSQNINFIKVGRGKVQTKVYSSQKIQEQLGRMKSSILFLHAVTGCDTTSFLFRRSKKKAFTLLRKQYNLQDKVTVYNECNASPDALIEAGEQFLLALYGASKDVMSLNTLRYHTLCRSVARSPVQTQMQLASLPPTSEAAKLHLYRVYHQVQLWHGNKLPPGDWGWEVYGNVFLPIRNMKPPAPDSLLKLISCNCKAGCERPCGCRKSGMLCSIMCGHCRGSACLNSSTNEEDYDAYCAENTDINTNEERLFECQETELLDEYDKDLNDDGDMNDSEDQDTDMANLTIPSQSSKKKNLLKKRRL